MSIKKHKIKNKYSNKMFKFQFKLNLKLVLKTILIFYLSISFNSALLASQPTKQRELNIIPLPSEVRIYKGEFMLSNKTKLFFVTKSDSLKWIADYFNLRISAATGFELKISETEKSNNLIRVNLTKNKDLGIEGYEINVNKNVISLNASTTQGVFYGFQTLLQLLPSEIENSEKVNRKSWAIPLVTIKDKPRFPYRGYMLDVSRHFFSVDFIKKQIDILAMFKINRFHWHLTDDQGWRLAIDKYPDLTKIGSKRVEVDGSESGGYYTKEQIKEVVDYASKRYITVIPEIEMPGHSLAALSSYPQLSCTGGPFVVPNYWRIEKDIYCAGKEETFQFIEDVLTEVSAIFPGTYIHIGGDEAPKDRWTNCPSCQKRILDNNLKDPNQLQSYFIKRVEKIASKLGKKIIGWDEILEGGIAPSATIMSWRGEKGGIEAANDGHNVIMTPFSHMYLDYYQGDKLVEPIAPTRKILLSDLYSYEPIPAEIDPSKSHYVLGAQANMWNEFVSTTSHVEYQTYPRIIALAELTWTNKERKNFDNFLNRLESIHTRLNYKNVNYHIPLPEGPLANVLAFTDSIVIPFTNSRNYPMVFTLDGTNPTIKSQKYIKPLRLNDSKVIKIATVLASGKISPVRTIHAEKQKLMPAYPNSTSEGFTKKHAEGLFLTKESLKNINFSQPQIIMNFPDSKSFGIEKQFVEVYEGYVEVPVDGVYTFACDKEMLWIGDKLLVDNYEILHRNLVNRAQIALSKGKHKFKMLIHNIPVKGHLPERNMNTFWLQSPLDNDLKKVESKALSH